MIDRHHTFTTKLGQVLHPLYRLWLFLVEPPASITDPDMRRRARLQGSLVVPFTLALVFVLGWDWLGETYRTFIVIGLVTLTFSYVMLRRGNYWVSITLGVGFLTVSPFMLFFSLGDYTQNGVTSAMIWLTPTLICAYLLLNLRGVVLTSLVSLLGLLALPIVEPRLEGGDIFYIALVLGVVVLLSIIAALVRDYDVKHSMAQSRALSESEARYRDLFNAAVEGMVVHKEGVIIDANPRFEAMTGYGLLELIGNNVLNLIAPEWRELAIRHTLSSEPYEVRAIRRDGSLMWVELQGSFRDYRGERVRVVSVRDIDERKHSEEQKLELIIEREKVNVLQRVISDISHDLKTPLSVIKTSIYLIRRLSDNPEKRDRQLEVLELQTAHLQRLLDDMLNMARLDKADASDYSLRLLDINFMVRDVVEDQQVAAVRKSQSLTFEAQADLPPTMVDESEFKRMIRHLVQNAVSYTPEGGRVRVTTEHDTTPDSASPDGAIIIRVHDSGKGIGVLELPYIFERFYRADSARNGNTGGTGLGLTIARKVAEAHGGTISAQSELERGSVFSVRLPVVKQAARSIVTTPS